MKSFTLIAISTMTLWSYNALATQTIDKRLAFPTNGSVEVSVVSGSLQVRAVAQNDVHVSGTISDDSKFESSVEGDRVVIKVKPPHDAWKNNQDANIVVELPATAKLITTTVSANTTIKGVQGTQQVQTVSGDIGTELQNEDLRLETVSGSIRVQGHGSPTHITLNSVSGNVNLINVGGFVDASSVSGHMNMQVTTISDAKIHTTAGDVELKGALAHDARLDIESISGKVTLSLVGQRDAQYSLSSFSGDISSCFSSAQPTKNNYGPGEKLQFTEGKGSARVTVTSMSGDIKICD